MSLRTLVCLNVITLICFLSTMLYIVFPNVFTPRLDWTLSEISKNGTKAEEQTAKIISATETTSRQLKLNHKDNDTSHIAKQYTFGDLQKSVCVARFRPIKNTLYSDVKKSCPKKGIVTIEPIGRTGNQMWEYSAVWSIAKDTGLEPYLPMCLKLKLEEVFENISLPTLESIAHCPFDPDSAGDSSLKLSKTKQNIIIPRAKFHIDESIPHLKEIIKQLIFKKESRDYAQQVLLELTTKLTPNKYTFIGVHVRRTDYIPYLESSYHSKPATVTYFRNAMNYYKRRFSNCLFIYVSDAPEWCFSQFGKLKDVFVPSYNRNSTAGEDLALMAVCNHTIFDYGTFGEWGAILAGGHAVFHKDKRNQNRGTQNLKNWIMMK